MANITGISPLRPVALSSSASVSASPSTGFSAMVNQAVQHLTTVEATAHQAISAAMVGNGSLTQVMLAMNAAQTTLDVATAVNSAGVQAYQSIMNMPLG